MMMEEEDRDQEKWRNGRRIGTRRWRKGMADQYYITLNIKSP